VRFKKIVLLSPEPSSSVLEKYRAGRRLRLKRSKEAEAALKECIQDCPDFEWPYGELAALLIDEKRFDEAETYLSEALKRKPEYVRGYLWMSQIYLHKGDLEKAATLLAQARSLDPEDEVVAQLPPIRPSGPAISLTYI
jgi:tetratricopeptide (TPR) repeat protein